MPFSSRRLLAAAAVAAAAAFLWRPGPLVDLKICVACAQTLAAGGDPYARDVSVDGVAYPCLYPPLAWQLFRPVAAAWARNPEATARAWDALQVLLFAGVLLAWRRRFLDAGRDGARLAFALFAFGAPLFVILRSGNGAGFEQLLLWAAFARFAQGDDLGFALLVAVAAQLKLQPAAFLILPLLRPRPNWRAALAGGGAAALAFALNRALYPGLLESMARRMADPLEGWAFERGPNNCSALALIDHVFETVLDRPVALARARPPYLAWVAVVTAATAAALARVWTARGPSEAARRRSTVLLSCAAYALVAPRFKDYAYWLVIPSALAALESDAPLGLRAAIVALACVNSAKGLAARLGLGPWALFAGYFKLYAVALVWGALARRAWTARPSESEPVRVAPEPAAV